MNEPFLKGFNKKAATLFIPKSKFSPENQERYKNNVKARNISSYAPIGAGLGGLVGSLAESGLRKKHLGILGAGIGTLGGIAFAHNKSKKHIEKFDKATHVAVAIKPKKG